MKKTIIIGLVGALILCACGDRDDLAPVVELHWKSANNHDKRYVVMRGDTLYSIAFRYDLDYRQLAAYNHLPSPYLLRVGQTLQLRAGRDNAPALRIQPVQPSSIQKRFVPRFIPAPSMPFFAAPSNLNWTWPAQGQVIARYAPSKGMKGIVIAGKEGSKIFSAGNGVVAYAGHGLVGYGNLIIIKHGSQFLTAYGNNQRNLVHEGQVVKKGQVIADMGHIDRRYWGVHFEIRHMGKPVDPMAYLK